MAARKKAKSKTKAKRKKARVTKAAARRKTAPTRKSKAPRKKSPKKVPVRRVSPKKLAPTAKAQTGATTSELDQRIAMVRQNINDLVEQAAAFSGAGDESRTADRIAQQEQELARLTKAREELSPKTDKP
jgi:hypothetical protein